MTWLVLWGCTGDTPTPDTTPPSDDTSLDTQEPVVTGGAVALSPADPMAGLDGLTCTIDEPLPDPGGTALRWEVDGVSAPEHDGRTELGADALAAGETWTCIAEDATATASASATVQPGPWELDPWVQPEVWVTPADAEPGDTVTVHYAGALAAPWLDHSFDGWLEGDEVDAYEDMGRRRYTRTAMVEAEGHWQLGLVLPETAAALDLRMSDGVVPEDQEHHHGLAFPWVGPYLHYTPDVQPADGVVVSWETATPSWGVVAWGTDERPRNLVVGDTWDTLHHVPLTDLPAGTEIHYQVFAPDGRASDLHSFRTPSEGAAMRVLLLADMQDSGDDDELWPTVAAEAWSSFPDADLLLLPGDLAYADHPGFWWLFWHGGRELFASVPLVAAVGNHDTPGSSSDPDQESFLRWMALDEPWLEVVYGGLRVLALSSEVASELELGSEQLTWAAASLEEGWLGDTRTDDWVFAMWHHPPYDVGARFCDDVDAYRDATALFDSRVDWVLTAHEHLYQRFHPMRYEAELVDDYGLGDDDGVGYLVLPSAGYTTYDDVVPVDEDGGEQRALLAWPELEPDSDQTPAQVGFAVMDLTPELLELQVWGMGTKQAPAAATLRESFSQERP